MSIFDTGFNFPVPGSVNVTADPNGGATGGTSGFFKGVTDFFGGMAGLFNNGVEIYKSVAGQYAAAKKITAETVTTTPTVVAAPGASSLLSKDNLIKMGAVVAIGALALILIRKR
jgi:hypothetical protein